MASFVNKIHARSTICVFLAYAHNSKSYNYFDPKKLLEFILVVRFHEAEFAFPKLHNSSPL